MSGNWRNQRFGSPPQRAPGHSTEPSSIRPTPYAAGLAAQRPWPERSYRTPISATMSPPVLGIDPAKAAEPTVHIRGRCGHEALAQGVELTVSSGMNMLGQIRPSGVSARGRTGRA